MTTGENSQQPSSSEAPHRGAAGEQQGRPGESAPGASSSTASSSASSSSPSAALSRRVLLVATATAAGLLGLIHALDVVQVLLGLSLTAYDLAASMSGIRGPGSELARSVPLNALQTLVLIVLSALAVSGGALAAARGGALSRIGGVLAVLTAILPLTLPVLVMSAGFLARGRESGYLVTVGLAQAVAVLSLLAGLSAAGLLLAATREPAPGPPRRRPVLALLGGGVFLIEELAVLVHVALGDYSWWAPAWMGTFGWMPPLALAGSVLLTAALALGALGAGGLLASSGTLQRVGGAVLLLAVLLRILTQVATWGMFEWVRLQMQLHYDLRAVIAVDTVPGVAVPVLAGLGLLLGLIGTLIPRSAASPEAGSSVTPV